jgi:hypothetical protein
MKDMRADIKDIRADIRQMAASIAALQGMQKAILWVLGGLGTIATIIGVGFSIAKALQWI